VGKLHVAVDLDGTITAAPKKFAKLLADLHDGGEKVTVLTGGNPDTDVDAKKELLEECGCDGAYDDLVIVDQGQVAENKAEWCKENDVDVFVDNNLANAGTVLASGHVPLVLVALTDDTKDVRARQAVELLRARLVETGA